MTDEELRRFGNLFLNSCRSSFEREAQASERKRGDRSPARADILWNASLRVENVRMRLRARPRIGVDNAQAWLVERLQDLLLDDEFMQAAEGTHLRMITIPKPSRPYPPIIVLLDDQKDISVADGLGVAIDLLQGEIEAQILPGPAADAERLQRIVPSQQIAPAQFAIVDGKVVVTTQPAHHQEEDAENIANARTALAASSASAVEELARSNCDPRLLATVKELHEAIQAESNVVQLGIMNIGCEAMRSAFECELPSATQAMLQGVTTGVAMYVAQFPEWQRFAEKAASVDLSQDDVTKIAMAADEIAQRLADNPALADPAVPKTIRALRALVSDPKGFSKRAAFALLRTLENLVAKVFQFGAEFLRAIAAKTADKLSGAVSTIIVIGLLSVAVAGATNLATVSSGIGGGNWMKSAAEIVQRQIESLSK